MQAIQTKYLGPGNVRGSRVKAWADGYGSVTLGWDHRLNAADNHKAAAIALIRKLEWQGSTWAQGHRDSKGDVFVRVHVASASNLFSPV